MADFNDIRALNPGATPTDTDLIVVQKLDGNPAAYTLQELAAYFAGVSLPTWQTDAAHGCYLTMSYPPNDYGLVEGDVVLFNTVVRDTGFYTNDGVITIPTNVIRIQIVAQVRTLLDTPTLKILKNGNLTTPIAVCKGGGGYALVVSPEIDVVAGDTFQIYCSGSDRVYFDHSFWNVRTIEKTV